MGKFFSDKIIPSKFDKCPVFHLNPKFPPQYLTDLHHYVKSFGMYNHLGARSQLPHNKLNVSIFNCFFNPYFNTRIVSFLLYLEE